MCRLRGRYGVDIVAGAYPLAVKIDDVFGSRSGPMSEPLARRDVFDGARGGGSFLGVGIHGGVSPAVARDIPSDIRGQPYLPPFRRSE
jgi:hypothetical protein